MGLEATFASRLASIHAELDFPPGVMLGILRVPILDGVLGELEALAGGSAADKAGPLADERLVHEIERMVDLFSGPWMGAAPAVQARRGRLVEILRRLDHGALPLRAFDATDAFGLEIRMVLETDVDLRLVLGALYPLAARASAVAPSTRWVLDARAIHPPEAPETDRAARAIRRVFSVLLRADIVSRPDILVGGLRLANQRLARGLLWWAYVCDENCASLFGSVGLRMGTSGRADAVVRDLALANTCAALLGQSNDPAAASMLAAMRTQVVNRQVQTHIDKALDSMAARLGVSRAEVVERSLPTFGLDQKREVMLAVGDAYAKVVIDDSGRVVVRWDLADGSVVAVPPSDVSRSLPAEVADVRQLAADIRSTLRDERRRMDSAFGSTRAWPELAWRARFWEHPLGGFWGRRLIWVLTQQSESGRSAVPTEAGWISGDGMSLSVDENAIVRLWHPVDASGDEIVKWQRLLPLLGISQPISQLERHTFRPIDTERSPHADLRFAGVVIGHRRLRALLRGRGWSAPLVGTWDLGDEAVAARVFDDKIRAELLYQAVERLQTGQHHERVRLVGVRFVAGDVLALSDVPARVFSEALRDVSLIAKAPVTDLP